MRLLIVEDEERLATILTRVFHQERYAVEVAHDGVAGLDLAFSGSFDAIILDRMLPGLDGIEIIHQLRADHVDTPILMLTARSELGERIEGLNAGADDYLGKPFSIDEAIARVAALVRRRDKPILSERQQVADLVVDFSTASVTWGDVPISLSRQEYLLLELLVRNRGQVIERDRILEKVWGNDADPLGNAVEIYIHYLRKKLGACSPDAARLITTVRGVGYLLAEN